ncbi:MAG: TRZ/ATZ family hydrolase [Pseudomonadales bacterium]
MSNSLRLQPSWVIPIRPENTVHLDFDLIICDGVIVDLLPRQAANDRYGDVSAIDLTGEVVLPGLINCHGHAAMTLLRGYADDHSLMAWLEDHIWPVEAKLVSPSFVHAGAWLAAAESLSRGTTCCADSYFFPQATAEAMGMTGIRSQITTPVIQFPNAWASTEEDHIAQSLVFFDWAATQPRLTVGFAPHAAYSLSDQGFKRIRQLALANDLPVHLHLHESNDEMIRHAALYQCRPIDRMRRLEMFDTRLQTVHMTQLLDEEISWLKLTKTPVVHCPESNMKLASGICPIDQLRAEGVDVALGTDGAASNNDLDLFQEMRTAALLAKVATGAPEALSAEQALYMATMGGAQFLGLDHLIGSLEIGKQADVISVRLSDIQTQPVYHPVSQLVYAVTGHNVTHTFVEGELLYHSGDFNRFDVGELRSQVSQWQARIGALI